MSCELFDDLKTLQKTDRIQINIMEPVSLAASSNYLVISDNFSVEIINVKSKKSINLIKISDENSNDQIEKMFIDDNRLFWKFFHKEEIHLLTFSDFKEKLTLNYEQSISSFLIDSDFLCIATDDCVELSEEYCSLNIWDIEKQIMIKQLEGYGDEFYFMLDIIFVSSLDTKMLIAATINSVDIWEWGTWKHLDRIEDIGMVHHCLYANDRIFVGDVEGYVNVWLKK